MRACLSAFLAAALLAPAAALACGACIEDKVAATYDHAIVTNATRHGKAVVFAEPRGPSDPAIFVKAITASAKHARGVDPGTVRTSTQPPTVSFALASGVAPEAALAAIERSAAQPGLHLVLVKVVR